MPVELWPLYLLTVVFGLMTSYLIMRAGLGDVPDHRSSHEDVIATGGGLVIIAVIGVFFLALSRGHPEVAATEYWPQILSLVWMVGFLGLMDDVYTPPTLIKISTMLVICGLAVLVVGPATKLPFAPEGVEIPYVAGYAGSILWLFVVMNTVNFMDGSNGLMAAAMGVAHTGLIVICILLGAQDIVWLSIASILGVFVFLPFNFGSRARLFSGDTGALTLGFTYGLTALWLCNKASGSLPVFIGPVLILPLLGDVLLTLLHRTKCGEDILKPHRSHIYQRLIQRGTGHRVVALIYASLTLVSVIYAWSLTRMGAQNSLSFLLMPTIIFISAYFIVDRQLRLGGY
ncbi:MAG: hypothetical protein GDA39_02325 [Hyphomonadaceae bacterium]|nr:hypothetical protein [Hyphomonadaceae bacterium]MBC6411808.1 hypothetical protein [Hyphomonadaceae bacterium]